MTTPHLTADEYEAWKADQLPLPSQHTQGNAVDWYKRRPLRRYEEREDRARNWIIYSCREGEFTVETTVTKILLESVRDADAFKQSVIDKLDKMMDDTIAADWVWRKACIAHAKRQELEAAKQADYITKKVHSFIPMSDEMMFDWPQAQP